MAQARMVAAATNNLCEAANSAVQGHASEEKLISSAKQVAASTAQLLVACKVKADQDSQTMKRLQVGTVCRPLYRQCRSTSLFKSHYKVDYVSLSYITLVQHLL